MNENKNTATHARATGRRFGLMGTFAVTWGVIAVLTLGLVALFANTTHDQPADRHLAVQTMGFCPLGHNANGGCRGGGLVDTESAKRAAEDTAKMYKDAAECAAVGVVGGLRSNAVDPFTPKTVIDSEIGGLVCGTSKGYWPYN
jgi:hypothetical protein